MGLFLLVRALRQLASGNFGPEQPLPKPYERCVAPQKETFAARDPWWRTVRRDLPSDYLWLHDHSENVSMRSWNKHKILLPSHLSRS